MFSLLNQNHRHLKKWDSCKDTLTTSLHLGTSHLHLFNFIYRWYIVDIFLANNYKYWSHIDLLHFPTPLSPQMGREARGQRIQRTSWWMERGRTIGQTALMFLRAECRPCKQCWWTVIVSKYLIFYKNLILWKYNLDFHEKMYSFVEYCCHYIRLLLSYYTV